MTTAKRTGLVCPACRQPVAIIERETDDAITFRCKACGHRWSEAKRRRSASRTNYTLLGGDALDSEIVDVWERDRVRRVSSGPLFFDSFSNLSVSVYSIANCAKCPKRQWFRQTTGNQTRATIAER